MMPVAIVLVLLVGFVAGAATAWAIDDMARARVERTHRLVVTPLTPFERAMLEARNERPVPPIRLVAFRRDDRP